MKLNATKFEKTQIQFKSDVFAAIAVVDAKSRHFVFFLSKGGSLALQNGSFAPNE